ncbi:unnamed protein product, partial [Meganyctiphanes norvegica]
MIHGTTKYGLSLAAKISLIAPNDQQDRDDFEDGKMRKYSSENGVDRPKKRKLDEGEMLRKRKKMIDKMNAKKEHLERKDSDGEKVANGSDSKASDKSIAASIESVINKARVGDLKKGDEENSNSSTGTTSSSSDSDSSNSSSSKDSDSEDENEEEEEVRDGDGEDSQEMTMVENGHLNSENDQDAPLPANLPQDLLVVLTKLKEEGRRSNTTSQKFFTDTVNRMLTSIEIKLNKIGGRKKTQTYNHLAQHLPCGTQTLIKRAKNLLAERNDNRLREPLKKLQDAVEKRMPVMLEMYNQECQKAAEMNVQNGSLDKDLDNSQDSDKKKASRLPKKKFIFTDEIRQQLHLVVEVRVSAWQIMKKRSETAEEHIKAFLDAEVRLLWPKGWINARILFKESVTAHACITDKTYVKANAAKNLSVLGGSSSPVTISQRELNTPKPSLTATAKPVMLPASPQQSTGTTTFKPITNTTSHTIKSSLVAPKLHKVQHSVSSNSDPKLDIIHKKIGSNNDTSERISISGLSIRSVDSINDVSSKQKTQINSMPISLTEKVHCNTGEKITNKRLSSDVIDLSSDDERCQNKSKPAGVSTNINKDSTNNAAKALSSSNNINPVKDDNLDEEMNSVMNEILNISRNYSPDRPSSVSNTKEGSNSVIVNSSLLIDQNQSPPTAQQSQSQVINKTMRNSVSSLNQQSLQQQTSPMPKPAPSANQQTVQHLISPMPKSVSTNQQSLHQVSPIQKQGSISIAPWSKMESNKIFKATNSTNSNISWAASTPVQDLSEARSNPTETLPIVSSSDPLANLKRMQGLSVSSTLAKQGLSGVSLSKSGLIVSCSVSKKPVAATLAHVKTTTSSTSTTSTSHHSILPHSSLSKYNLLGTSATSSTNSNINNPSSGIIGNTRASISIVKSPSVTSAVNHNSNSNPTYVNDAVVNQALKQKTTSQNISSGYAGMTQEQLQQYKQQLQQHQKTQELLQQNLLSSMGQMSNSDVYKLMTQMGYKQSQTGSGQNPGQL